MGIGTRIRTLRKQKKFTQSELAEKINVHETTIRRWELERQGEPDGSSIKNLAKALGTTSAYLFGDTDDPLPKSQKNFENISTLDEDEQSLSYKMENRDTGMASFTSKDGNRFEAPATPEGYAFLREMLRASEMPKQL